MPESAPVKRDEAKKKKAGRFEAGPGLKFGRYFGTAGVHPYDEIEWDRRTAAIVNDRGEVVFEQKDVEVPKSWSQLATNVVVSKYFKGGVDQPNRERSVRQLIDRVVRTTTEWGIAGGYFADEEAAEAFRHELTWILVNQYACFNSPVWFNMGVEADKRPQVSACFINSVKDSMGSILDLAKTEGMLFKYGSGTGTNFSTLRGSKERLSTGGQASGPVSFMKGFDAFANGIKCVTGDTLVWTDGGATPILAARGRIATGRGYEAISEFHANEAKPVAGIRLSYTGLELRGTPNHPVLTMTPDGLEWKHLGDLAPGDPVAVARHHWPEVKEEPELGFRSVRNEAYRKLDYRIPERMSPDLAYLLGLLVAEGSIDENRVRMTNGDREVVQCFAERWERVFGFTPTVRREEAKNTFEVASHAVDVVALFRQLGLRSPAGAKEVPAAIVRSTRESARMFLRGYFDGDGSGGAKVSAVSKSKALRDMVQQMLLALGVACARYTTTHGYFGVRMSGAAARRFHEVVGFECARKREFEAPATEKSNVDVIPGLLSGLRARSKAFGWFDGPDGKAQAGFGFFNRTGDTVSVAWLRERPEVVERIREVSPELYAAVVDTLEYGFLWDRVAEAFEDEAEPTYDLTVPGAHSFVGNGIVCHNSGGKTRRAAKMVILDVDHPDVVEFIKSKAEEEKKAWSLIDAGYDGSVNGEAYSSVYFQNGNHSVRVTDDFMRAVLQNGEWSTVARTTGEPMETYRARDLMRMISEAAHQCGDPGLQFDTTINAWHTCAGTDRIYASNPCVVGDTLVATRDGMVRIDRLLEKPTEVVGSDGRLHEIAPAFPTGVKPVYRLTTRGGRTLTLTADHRVLTANRGDVPACELTEDDVLLLGRPTFGGESVDDRLGEFIGLLVGDGCLTGRQEIATITLSPDEDAVARRIHDRLMAYKRETAADARAARDVEVTQPQGTLRLATSARCVVDEVKRLAVAGEGSAEKRFTDAVFRLDRASVAALLRGLFTADGTVANYGEKSQYVGLDSTSLDLLSQVQLLLLSFGIKATIHRNRRVLGQTTALLPDGKGGRKEYPVRQIHSLRITRTSRRLFEREIGFVPGSRKVEALAALNREVGVYEERLEDRVASLEFVGEEPVYDLTERDTSHFVANGIVVHNCSEYMFLNDTACNLASLNLMKFRDEEGNFDVPAFRAAVRTVFTAQEIFVDFASYPTPQIEENSHLFRPIGLGYANLGALLMARGLPYDGDAGRAWAAAITAVMCGEAYRTSAEIAKHHGGPFPKYVENRDPFLRVMMKHRAAVEGIDAYLVPESLLDSARLVWDEAITIGRQHGFRNAQATVLAPTGTIAFMMDCDTTGVEPDIALVKYKKLVGGGLLKIVNQTVPEALRRLGYSEPQVAEIVAWIDREETIEGAPHVKPEHLPVFDCAFQARNGSRSIAYMGHIRMMAAVQPFLSGAISKTVNLPGNASVKDIEDCYIEAWRLGLKAIAIYRDGSKRIQPLGTSNEERAKANAKERKPVRRKLPDERKSLTHKFRIGDHKGYLTVGFYEDGTPGEIFVTMAKEGSTVRGLMDTVATLVSICLQYGVPLEDLVRKFEYVKFEPNGMTNAEGIRFAHSIVDYIFRWLGKKYLAPLPSGPEVDEDANTGGADAPEAPSAGTNGGNGHGKGNGNGGGNGHGKSNGGRKAAAEARGGGIRVKENLGYNIRLQTDAPPCAECGSIMVRQGSCYKCLNCGTTSGCS